MKNSTKLFKKIPLIYILSAPFLAQILIALVLTGYLGVKNGQKTDLIGSQIQEKTKNTITLSSLALVGVSMTGIFTTSWVCSSLKKLQQSGRAIASGELHQPVQIQGIAELESLGQSLNQMAQQLETSSVALAKSQEDLELKIKERTAALEDLNRRLYCLASLDGLTKVANRRRFDQYLAQQWLKVAQGKGHFSLILCDIDYFKFYNDYYGHQQGDLCLQKVATTIKANLQHPGSLVARYGGEEFAVILPNTNCQQALRIAESLRLSVKNLKIPHHLSPASSYVTLSLGVGCLVPTPELEAKTVITAADGALYTAKRQGRDRVVLHPSSVFCALFV